MWGLEFTAADVLVRQRLAKALRRRGDGAAQQQAQLLQEALPEGPPALLQPAGGTRQTLGDPYLYRRLPSMHALA